MCPKHVVALFAVYFATFEWARSIYGFPPQPVITTIAAVVLVLFAAWRMMRARKLMRNLRQGRDGERAVAEALERMREEGFRVFQDLVGPDSNVDHLLVGPQGLFVIETKAITRPVKGEAKVQYDGEAVTLGGFTPDRDPIRQVAAIAKWVRDLVRESSGHDHAVRPVVLYPGWYVEASARNSSVWVLNPKALPAFIAQERSALSPEEVKLVTYHLSRYARTATEG